MNMQERDQDLARSTEDLEVTSAEWFAALDESDNGRARQALDDLEAIVKRLRELW